MSVSESYIELHCLSCHSHLRGASTPADLAARAAELGMPALALTDHQGLYGAIRFKRACEAAGIRPIYGAVITLAAWDGGVGGAGDRDGSGDRDGRGDPPVRPLPPSPTRLPSGQVTLLVRNASGWANLCRMLSQAGLRGTKRERPVPWDLLARHAGGLICLSGGRDGVLAQPARRGDREMTLEAGRALARIFGPDDCYVELQRHLDHGDRRLDATLAALAGHLGLQVVATNDVHYAQPDGYRLQHVLTCIRERTSLDEAGALLHATPHRHLKDTAAMRALFADRPDAVANTRVIAERCTFELDHADARLPAFPVPAGETAFGHLLALCYAGLRRRYDPVSPAAAEQLTRELAVIERERLADYFLVVHDIVDFARREGIACQGRGSAAGSVVAYVLGITPVDPLAHDLLFERFLAEGRKATPDIDIDFAADRREEVLQYVYRRYGEAYTGMVANVVTFRARSAVADVGKALGFPPELLADVRRHLYARAAEDVALDLAEVERFEQRMGHLPWRLLVEMCTAIDGFPRHLSIHSGGMLVTAKPLAELVPLEPATMPGRVVVQWDKDDVEDAGLIKIDLLSLRTLGQVDDCLRTIRASGGPHMGFDDVPHDDEATWEMIRAADTMGVFQIESRAQLSLLPRMLPRVMADLIVGIALIRPGPVQGGMAAHYLKRRDGEEPVEYWHPSLEPVLAETLGVLVFQEQVLRVAMTVAGFSGAQADTLRRAMSRKRSREAMETRRAEFVVGAAERGMSGTAANEIYDHLLGFASYGFCKSHAAAFARLTWVSAWLKCHHPLAFYRALLNAQPMGFYSVEAVVEDAKRHAIKIRPMHVNSSGAEWGVEGVGVRAGEALRVPLGRVKGVPEELAARIVAERERGGVFTDLWDFVRRVRPPRRLVERLVRAGGLDGLGVGGGARGDVGGADRSEREGSAGGAAALDRRQLLWALGEMRWAEGELDLSVETRAARLPRTEHADVIAADYDLLGVAQDAHLVSLIRPELALRDVLPCDLLATQPDGVPARVAGRLEVLQRPGTAKGVAFATLEDETGLANLILYPKVFEAYRGVFRAAPVLIAEGRVQHDRGTVHLITERVMGVGGVDGEGGEGAGRRRATGSSN